MKIFINNREQDINPAATIAEALVKLDIRQGQGMAVAVNDHVIPRSEWNTMRLKEGDKVLLIQAARGG